MLTGLSFLSLENGGFCAFSMAVISSKNKKFLLQNNIIKAFGLSLLLK